MSHPSCYASVIGVPLALAALLACVTPAGARLASNGIAANGIAANGIAANGIIANGLSMNGSALGGLNGVVVEAVILPDATR